MVMFKPVLGMRFGSIEVIGEDGGEKRLCRCDCGNTKLMRVDGLKTGRVKTCGSCNRSNDRMSSVLGHRYGYLVVVEEHQVCRNRRVMVRCDCGNVVEKLLSNLKRGQSKSCGCIKSYGHTHGRIYYLVDPITSEVRYVGQTVQDSPNRLHGHVCVRRKSLGGVSCKAKTDWVRSLRPLKPVFFVSETNVPIACLDLVEKQHIACQLANGANLLNQRHRPA